MDAVVLWQLRLCRRGGRVTGERLSALRLSQSVSLGSRHRWFPQVVLLLRYVREDYRVFCHMRTMPKGLKKQLGEYSIVPRGL